MRKLLPAMLLLGFLRARVERRFSAASTAEEQIA
jgi:hypothetical protein